MINIRVTYDEYSKKIRLNPETVEIVREHFSVESIKAKMNKKIGYKLPKREYIISPNGLCDPAFLFQILKYFKDLDIKVKVDIDDKSKSIIHPKLENIKIVYPNNEKYVPRYYQIQSIESTFKRGRGINKMGTGAGKSLSTFLILQSYHGYKPKFKTVIIVPNLGLVEQLYNDFENYGANFTVSKWTGSIEPDWNSNVIITNNACICGKATQNVTKYEWKLYEWIQSNGDKSYNEQFETIKTKVSSIIKPIVHKDKKYKTLEEFFEKQDGKYLQRFVDKLDELNRYSIELNKLYKACDLLIVDECHEVNSNGKLAEVLDHFETSNRIGYTGTLSKNPMDRWICLSKIGPVIYSKSSKELRDEDYISNADIYMLKMHYKNSPKYKIKKNGEFLSPTENYNIEKEFIYLNEYRKHVIRGLCNKYSENILLLVENLDRAEDLYQFLQTCEGKQIHYIHGGVEVDDRERVKQLMEKYDNVICIAISKIFTVGISINNLPIIITDRFGKSFIKIIQGIGRGLRKHKNKNKLKLFDMCDNLRYSKKHLEERIEFYAEEQFNYKLKDIYER